MKESTIEIFRKEFGGYFEIIIFNPKMNLISVKHWISTHKNPTIREFLLKVMDFAKIYGVAIHNFNIVFGATTQRTYVMYTEDIDINTYISVLNTLLLLFSTFYKNKNGTINVKINEGLDFSALISTNGKLEYIYLKLEECIIDKIIGDICKGLL